MRAPVGMKGVFGLSVELCHHNIDLMGHQVMRYVYTAKEFIYPFLSLLKNSLEFITTKVPQGFIKNVNNKSVRPIFYC